MTDDDKLLTDSIERGRDRAKRLAMPDAAVAFDASKGTLIAEGDSWFDYPVFEDILEALKNNHGYRVRSEARFGDTAESMAYDPRQLARFRRLFRDVKEAQTVPKGVLLSCGGNDIVDVLSVILNHAQSGLPALSEELVHGLLDVRLKTAQASLLGAVLTFCEEYFAGEKIPVVIHGYGHAVPDGRGYPLGRGGPWLKPAFASRGYVTLDPQPEPQLAANAALIRTLIDRLNDKVLQPLAAHPAFEGKVKYVDLRPVFSNVLADDKYRDSWRDEMHATKQAYTEAAKLIADALE